MKKKFEKFDCTNCKKDECDGCETPQPKTFHHGRKKTGTKRKKLVPKKKKRSSK